MSQRKQGTVHLLVICKILRHCNNIPKIYNITYSNKKQHAHLCKSCDMPLTSQTRCNKP